MAFFLFLGHANAQDFSIDVTINGLENDNGVVLLQLVSMSEEGEENVVMDVEMTIKSGKSHYSIKDVPKGVYGIKYFHDEDRDYELDTNWIGMPTEAYGFSNNVKGTFGPPDYSEWKFMLSSNLSMELDPTM